MMGSIQTKPIDYMIVFQFLMDMNMMDLGYYTFFSAFLALGGGLEVPPGDLYQGSVGILSKVVRHEASPRNKPLNQFLAPALSIFGVSIFFWIVFEISSGFDL